jgi:uncharacterized protein DUF6578
VIVEVEVGGWEHQCCGPAVERGQVVKWAYHVDGAGVRHETHHLPEDAQGTVSGRVTGVRLLADDGVLIAIDRAPSGCALLGNTAADDRFVTRLDTDEVIGLSDDSRFIVTLSVG